MNMDNITIPGVMLNSGYIIPLISMGTATSSLPPPEKLTSIFIDAIATGYCHFDTAALYDTEEPLGRAVGKALELGVSKNRDEVFITSKLWCTDAHHDLVLPAIKETLRKLDLSYLYLIHWPVRLDKDTDTLNFPEEIRHLLNVESHGGQLGFAKSIGVSNFSCAKLQQVMQHATIPPAVKQVEMNVAWQQKTLLEFCRINGVHVSAWSPLGANGEFWGSYGVMKNPVLQNIAAARNKTVAQVALRWVREQV